MRCRVNKTHNPWYLINYKRCLKLARKKLEEEENISELERKEMEWVEYLKESRNKPLSEKLIQLKVS